ncbi:MAG: UDP-N-acetylmuramate:L-alanyl-gamma-D-glutamyl-meso-diaminopimelate ligase, partial [Arenicella sp.]|nr:UDP-N-acetylmuramate:L-alanyl-gamma-D-glutamyl-meso-diaminopimelate ligase [Arenicella sp.]
IELFEGYSADNIPESTDIVLVGNTISRGNPELESVLDKGLRYTSGAQWLGDHVLQGRWVLAVAGTHGKTTTCSLLAWLLEQNDLAPGYLIGGVPENFGESARLGKTPFFVIEADEYDTAFCDKRSKFVHYQPRTLILNNLEFDHADIFTDLAAIQNQFNHLLKTVPQHGQIIYNEDSPALAEVLEMGCWSELRSFNSTNSDWRAEKVKDDASEFLLLHGSEKYIVSWSLMGDHNMANAVAAIAAAHHVGIPIANSVESLATFKSVKRRMEVIFDQPVARIYDDFAHHPTAIAETLGGLRSRVGDEKIIAVLEPRSNTMKRGVHKHLLQDALAKADTVLVFADQHVKWDISELESDSISAFSTTELLLQQLTKLINQDQGRTNVLIMSNGGFENIYQRLINYLK